MSFPEPVKARSLAAFWSANQTAILNLVQTVGIIGTLLFALWSHRNESNGQSAHFMLEFATMLDSGKSGLIATELDENDNLDKFALKGVAEDEAIDDFLSKYELLNVTYEHHLISDDMTYDAFSWELEKAVRDQTIREFIADSKAGTDNSDVFDGVIDLAHAFGIKFDPILPSKLPPTPNPSAVE